MQKISIIIFFISFSTAFAQNKISVVTQHNNLHRTGCNDKETILTPSNVNTASFGIIGSFAVDDQVYAQPLIVRQLTINSFTGSVVFVATVNNSVYAFNADDVSYGASLWQVSLNSSGQRAPNIFDLQDAVNGKPCGGNYRDFSGNIGIVGTPAIDTNFNTLFVVTKTIDANGNFSHYLNAIDIITGQHKTGSPKKIVASVNGNGDGSVNGVLNYDAKFSTSGLHCYYITTWFTSQQHHIAIGALIMDGCLAMMQPLSIFNTHTTPHLMDGPAEYGWQGREYLLVTTAISIWQLAMAPLVEIIIIWLMEEVKAW